MSLAKEPTQEPEFMHPSEAEIARLLDFYGVEWEYEPHTFTLDRDADGLTTRAFTPDFYVPAWNLYIEVTTRKPNLMAEKRRKVAALKELRPDLNVKLLNREDLELLLRKFQSTGRPPE